jgi:hypothetical protein
MSRCILLLTLWLLVVGLAPLKVFAVDDMYAIKGPNDTKRFLGAVNGKVRFVKGGQSGRHWTIDETKKGQTIRLLSNDKWDGWYLTCDPKGKSKAVFLSRKPTAGSYWSLGSVGERHPTPITAEAGKLKRWYLNTGAKAERLKDVNGRPYHAFVVILSKEPKPIPEFHTYPVAK